MIDVTINGKSYKYQQYKGTNSKWPNKADFVEHLKAIQLSLDNKIKYQTISKQTNCSVCSKKNIGKRQYKVGKVMWDDGLLHYITKHNLKPSDIFIDKIFRYQPGKKIISIKRDTVLKGVKIVKKNKIFLKLDKNQLLIMDALYEHGSKKIYNSKHDEDDYKYSEHTGLLDFNDHGLEKIVVSGRTTRIDKNDKEIYLPKNMVDAYDYEYIFHTHPLTPKLGGRAKDGILYEFPSSSDVLHFLEHYNEGNTQGSIVVTPEGMYIIRKHITDNKRIDVDPDKLYDNLNKVFEKLQRDAIEQYGIKFSESRFYNKVAQDTTYIDKVNKFLHKYGMHIDYFCRIKDSKGDWILDTVYLPVYVVEPVNL